MFRRIRRRYDRLVLGRWEFPEEGSGLREKHVAWVQVVGEGVFIWRGRYRDNVTHRVRVAHHDIPHPALSQRERVEKWGFGKLRHSKANKLQIPRGAKPAKIDSLRGRGSEFGRLSVMDTCTRPHSETKKRDTATKYVGKEETLSIRSNA